MQARIVLVTAPDSERAAEISRKLVAEGLAACVNILPGITSIYRWQGKLEESAEVLMAIKSTADRLPELEQRVMELHPYDTPEFVALEPGFVSERYLSWLVDSCRQ